MVYKSTIKSVPMVNVDTNSIRIKGKINRLRN